MTRRLLRVAVAAALALGGLAAVGPAAQAAGYEGYCTDDQGVTVVVDFQGPGGGIVIRCTPAPLPGAGSGLDALKGAGVPTEGVSRWGDAFICRIYGKPAATQDLAIAGNPSYHEQCIDTPPAAAYWSYWSAPNGGPWSYSSFGVKNRKAVAGGFEGWSFSLNATSGATPAPRVTPRRPAAPSPPAASPSPTSTNAAGTNPVAPGAATTPGRAVSGGSGPVGSGSAAPQRVPANGTVGTAAGGTSLPPSLAATEPPVASSPSAGSSGSASSMPATPSAPSDTTGGLGAPSSATTTDASGRVVSSDQVLAESALSGGGIPVATVLGLGVLAFLVTAGAGTAWRRRRR